MCSHQSGCFVGTKTTRQTHFSSKGEAWVGHNNKKKAVDWWLPEENRKSPQGCGPWEAGEAGEAADSLTLMHTGGTKWRQRSWEGREAKGWGGLDQNMLNIHAYSQTKRPSQPQRET